MRFWHFGHLPVFMAGGYVQLGGFEYQEGPRSHSSKGGKLDIMEPVFLVT